MFIAFCNLLFVLWTWRPTPTPDTVTKNVVVLGGSFAGIELVRRLVETLPTGYRVILVEKNSHLHYAFNFPRFAVMKGHESEAFIPYRGVERQAVVGILTRIQGVAVGLTQTQVILASGERIGYAYLAIATGSSQPLPARVTATEQEEACRELRGVQGIIGASERIAVVGGGAVGVEMASDIKDFCPDKDVTLIHSRERLLNGFGERLGAYALAALRDELDVRVLLGERPALPVHVIRGGMAGPAALTFSDGNVEEFDLVINCTGQRPNSSILSSLFPSAISKETSRILVRPTLQVVAADDTPNAAEKETNIFAFGDVAEHGGPRMARAGWMQAPVVLDNILAMIRGKKPSRKYTPDLFIEGAIKLTLGKTHSVVKKPYAQLTVSDSSKPNKKSDI
ncbi:hypothetical protein B0T16DRAFT_424041 [Cercophora newfieldiana]|uniref:FAD/NAD(P)-binding domain-containing protein n=1 Tax=Cercophora newfieldiana TaxID=92897 RepID=A0AA40CY38_9PEZI|nr:hypothetical protein B0T16DRAFT_424041 [Cercophora newfieldiana]